MNHIYLIRLHILKRPSFQSQKYGIPSIALKIDLNLCFVQ